MSTEISVSALQRSVTEILVTSDVDPSIALSKFLYHSLLRLGRHEDGTEISVSALQRSVTQNEVTVSFGTLRID